MDNYFEAIENLEKELYFLSTGEKNFINVVIIGIIEIL